MVEEVTRQIQYTINENTFSPVFGEEQLARRNYANGVSQGKLDIARLPELIIEELTELLQKGVEDNEREFE